MKMSSVKHLSCQFILTLAAIFGAGCVDEYYTSVWARCFYSSPDLSDMVYIANYYFNKFLFVQFNSTMNRFLGFNEYGTYVANTWNNNSEFLHKQILRVDTDCRFNIKHRNNAIFGKRVKPKIKLSLEKQVEGRNPATVRSPAVLMCSAYEFYPPDIKISWLKNGKAVTSDVTSVMEMADGDWFYQIHSELVYIPKPEEKISCMVEHASFNKPMIYDWDPILPEPGRNQFIFGGCSLALGIIILTAGVIHYHKKLMEERRFIETLDSAQHASSTPRSESPLSIAVTTHLLRT